MSIYDQHLDKTAANFVALSPVSFVERSAEVFADLPAVIHGARRYNWAQCRERSARLAARRARDAGATLSCPTCAARWTLSPQLEARTRSDHSRAGSAT
jgi:hypothetical protein